MFNVLMLSCFSSTKQDSDNDESKHGGGGPGPGHNPDGGNEPADPFATFPGSEDEDEFPPRRLLGPASDSTAQPTFTAAAGPGGRGGDDTFVVHPIVARRGLDFLWYLCKTSSRVTYDILTAGPAGGDDSDSAETSDAGRRVGAGGGGNATGIGGNVLGVGGPVAEAKGIESKGKAKKVGSPKGKGKQSEAMDVAGALSRFILTDQNSCVT